jgi:hypothetical protein
MEEIRTEVRHDKDSKARDYLKGRERILLQFRNGSWEFQPMLLNLQTEVSTRRTDAASRHP